MTICSFCNVVFSSAGYCRASIVKKSPIIIRLCQRKRDFNRSIESQLAIRMIRRSARNIKMPSSERIGFCELLVLSGRFAWCSEIRLMKSDNGLARAISTVGRDGQLIVWDLKTISQKMADLKIF